MQSKRSASGQSRRSSVWLSWFVSIHRCLPELAISCRPRSLTPSSAQPATQSTSRTRTTPRKESRAQRQRPSAACGDSSVSLKHQQSFVSFKRLRHSHKCRLRKRPRLRVQKMNTNINQRNAEIADWLAVSLSLADEISNPSLNSGNDPSFDFGFAHLVAELNFRRLT